MLVNTLYIKIHNQIQVHFSVVYTFYKLRNEFCFNNTNCNARTNDTFFTTVPCVLRVRWQGGINLRMQRLECFFLDWTVGDYSISSHISVVTYLRDKDLNYLPWRDSPQWAKGLLSVEDSWSHTFRHTTLDRIPPDNWSARSRDLYLTTHNTSQYKHPCSRRDSNPQSQQASGRRPTPMTERPLGSAKILN